MTRKLTINLRIAITITFLGALLVVIGALGIFGMAESNQAQREAYDVHFASVVALGKSGTAMSRARFGLDWAMSNPHSPQLNAQLERARMMLGESDTWWRSFRDLPKTRELQRLTDDLDAKRTAVRRDGIDQLIDAIRTGDASWMDETRANRLIALYAAMNASQGALEAYLNQQAADANERSAALFHGLLSASIGSVLIGLTVAFFSWRTLRRAIMDLLHAALRQFDAIAAGELTKRVAIRSNDEMATLLRGLASMQDKLCATVTNVRAGSGESRRHADGRGDPAERGARGGKRGDRELARGSGAAVERTDWGVQSCARLNRLATARSERIASRLMPLDAAGCLPTLRVAIHCLIHCFTQPDENAKRGAMHSRNRRSCRHLAERNGEAVPRVDRRNKQRQVDQFLVAEMRAHRFPNGVGHMVVRDEREGFRPFQRGAFAIGEERCFAPGDDCGESPVCFAGFAGVGSVHVDAESTAVDLRRAQANEVRERLFNRRLSDAFFKTQHGLDGGGTGFVEIETLLHDSLLGVWWNASGDAMSEC